MIYKNVIFSYIYIMHPNKKKLIEEIKMNNLNKPLIFIHTPKCAGTYIRPILKDLNIQNKGHHLADLADNAIHFTVIRHPVSRFESLLNYRLTEKKPRPDWPKHLDYVYSDPSITLNKIVKKMTNEEIKSFSPYKTLHYWSTNVDICIEIHELKELLEIFGYIYDETKYQPANVSKKFRGTLNIDNKNKLCNLYKKDINFFYRCTSDLPNKKNIKAEIETKIKKTKK